MELWATVETFCYFFEPHSVFLSLCLFQNSVFLFESNSVFVRSRKELFGQQSKRNIRRCKERKSTNNFCDSFHHRFKTLLFCFWSLFVLKILSFFMSVSHFIIIALFFCFLITHHSFIFFVSLFIILIYFFSFLTFVCFFVHHN